MGLEMRKGRNGELIMHWFGAYKDETGKRIVRSLTTPIAGKVIPKSLLEKGDADFEASRAAAIAELEGHTTSSREKGRAQHLTARLIEAMEMAGLVGPLQSNGGREILVPAPNGN